MTVGRKPTPTALRVLRGNPARRPLPKDEPTPAAVGEAVAPPEGLNAAAVREWKRVAPALARVGLLTDLDLDALAAYCVVCAEWRTALKHIEDEGAIILSPNKYPMPSPWVSMAARAFERMRVLMTEFGLTPASRTRVTRATPKIDPTNPLDKFIRR
jgi:P27 family predicted phage terminase small subunit